LAPIDSTATSVFSVISAARIPPFAISVISVAQYSLRDLRGPMLGVLSGSELIRVKDPSTEITKITADRATEITKLTEVGTDRFDRNICLLDLCDLPWRDTPL
jgi:hypothetical protein